MLLFILLVIYLFSRCAAARAQLPALLRAARPMVIYVLSGECPLVVVGISVWGRCLWGSVL